MKERFKRFLQELMLVEWNEEGSGLSQSQSQIKVKSRLSGGRTQCGKIHDDCSAGR